MSRKAVTFWAWFVVWLILDQITKLWVYGTLELGPPYTDHIVLIEDLLMIVHAENPGAAFSMLAGFEYRTIVFMVFTAIAGWVVWHEYRQIADDDRLTAVALGLIGSGAAGNFIDRVWKQTVTDFIRVHVETPSWRRWLIETFGTNEWPAFNVADSTLLGGVIIFVIMGFVNREEPDDEADAPTQATGDAASPEA